MINILNVSKSFGKKEAVKDLYLSLNDGEVFGLLGPNGAGKSTTLKMITGILKPDKGDVLIDNISITKDSLEAKKHFSYVPDSPDMFLGMKGIDYLIFIASIFKVSGDVQLEIKKLSEEFSMSDSLGDLIINYSHGMRQKIFIIASLLVKPRNWILDEPLTGLDPDAAYKVKNRMRDVASNGGMVLFSTHVLDVAEKICDRIGIISDGEFKFIGTLEELRQKENLDSEGLENLFLNLVK